ncbi:MAG: DegT/DnrJ/EryC1/StrS family aminotransferase [Acidobacteriota bacterium]
MIHTSASTGLQPVPMLDLGREFTLIRDEVMAAIETVCASQRFILGPAVDAFEAAAAQALPVAHAIGCASGTDALWLALAALEIGNQEPTSVSADAVITTPFSFFATVSSILRAGAKPLLADIDPATFNLSADSVRETIAAQPATTRVAAIMPVHLYGQCADMDALGSVASDHNLRIVEDAAQAFGALWDGRPAGNLGDATAFSFYPTKNLSAFGDAGLVTTNSATVDERTRMLRAHGMRRRYFHDEIGWNSRIDSIQAAVLTVKLKRLPAANQRRREIATLYDRLFTAANLTGASTAEGIVLPITDPRAMHIFHQYVIRAPRRDELRAYLTGLKIGSDIYYPVPLHLQHSLAFLGYKQGDFPHSEKAAAEVLALPIYPELREDEAETVVEAIRRFYA